MDTLIVYESMYGNTRKIAEAIARGVGGEVAVRSVHEAPEIPEDLRLLVVGGPTHIHGLSTGMSRKAAAEAAAEDGHQALEPSAVEGDGLRRWLHALPDSAAHAAAFDTRGDKSPYLTGSAARGIRRRLHHRHYAVDAIESFTVDETEGPLSDGELDRAEAWGRELAAGNEA